MARAVLYPGSFAGDMANGKWNSLRALTPFLAYNLHTECVMPKMAICPRCRRNDADFVGAPRTGMCGGCRDESAMQALRAPRVHRLAAERTPRILGAPRAGRAGTTWPYMKVRRTSNYVAGVNREFRARLGGAMDWTEYCIPLEKVFLRRK